VLITASDGTRWNAKRLIVAAGPWLIRLLPELRPHVHITRQMVGWFGPDGPPGPDLATLPVFMLDTAEGHLYGLPDIEGRGVKAAFHDHGPPVGCDDWGPAPTDAELAAVAEVLGRHVPGAIGSIRDRDVCLYTNTGPGNATGGDAGEFILDRLPADPRIIVASPCSGHGFKFAPAIGEILADMALNDEAMAHESFQLRRFSTFAGGRRSRPN
jgi:sarcosine oxidase